MPNPQDDSDRAAFEAASRDERTGLFAEVFAWLGDNKKWWLAPIVLAILLIGGLLVFGAATGATPFIYTLW